LFNSIAILSLLSNLERSLGLYKSAGIFFLSGVGGNIFSACCSAYTNSVSAGASTCIMGIIGCWLAFLIMNWKALKEMFGEMMRCMMTCMVVMYTFLIWMLSFSFGTI